MRKHEKAKVKAKANVEAVTLAMCKHKVGWRIMYEERILRKAKRKGMDLEHYLRIGFSVPTVRDVERTRAFGSKREREREVGGVE